MSSLQPLANQEICIGCEHDSQVSAVLPHSPSVLPVSPILGLPAWNSIAHILTSAIYYDGADTNQIPANAPLQQFLTLVLNNCVSVSRSVFRFGLAALFSWFVGSFRVHNPLILGYT